MDGAGVHIALVALADDDEAVVEANSNNVLAAAIGS
jgi:hypothetical protein